MTTRDNDARKDLYELFLERITNKPELLEVIADRLQNDDVVE